MADTTFTGLRQTAQTNGIFCGLNTGQSIFVSTIYGPFVNAKTTVLSQGTKIDSTTGILYAAEATAHTTADTYDGIVFTVGGTMTGFIRIYGMLNS